MAKNISIELLQNREKVRVGSQLLTNYHLTTTTDWDFSAQFVCTAVFTYASGVVTKSDVSSCARFHQDITLTEGFEYECEIAIKNYNGSGSILLANHGTAGANVVAVNSTIIPAGAKGSDSGSGAGQYAYVKTRWVQGTSNLDKLMIYASSILECQISYVTLYRVGTNKSSVFGTLDASTSDEFPLALTFAINNSDDIDARKGAYSKTFKIPATANNNTILKHFNITNSTNFDAPLFDKIPCRILVGNLFSLTGLIQIKDVEVINNKPLSYGCTFLGDNLAWSTLLDNKYLSDLQLANSTNLQLSAKEIINSFAQDSATSRTELDGTVNVNTSPVVYPITTYGITNEQGHNTGEAIQMLRTEYEYDYIKGNASTNSSHVGLNLDDKNSNNGINSPSMDWRPQVWIYNMINQIFSNIGYKISSSFIESNNFKRLLYASPNFLFNNGGQHQENNSYISNFGDTSSGSASQANLLFYDDTVQVDSPTFPSSTDYNSYIGGWETIAGASDTAVEVINLTSATCGTSDGSCNFQPKPSAGAVFSGGLLQSDTYGQVTGSYGTTFRIGKAGYYLVDIQGISGDISILRAPLGGWGGGGYFSGQTNADIKLRIGFQVDRVGHNGDWVETGSANWTNTIDVGNAASNVSFVSNGFTFPSIAQTAYLNKGDRIRLVVQFCPKWEVRNSALNYTDGITHFNASLKLYGTSDVTLNSGNGSFEITLQNPETPAFGSVYNLQDVLPDTQKQIDFIKGLAHSFNLQFLTNEAQKTVYIEPFSDFYLPPKNAIDWTWKLDRGKSNTDSFIENNFTRRLVFKYKTDGRDYRINSQGEKYFDGVLDIYPKILNIGNTYPAGETVFQNPFFAGTYETKNANISYENTNLGNNNYSAALWQTPYGNVNKGYDFLPRLLLYNKHVRPFTTATGWIRQGYQVDGFGYNANPYFRSIYQISDVTTIAFGSWNEASSQVGAFNSVSNFVNRYEFTNQFGLSYGNYWAKDYDQLTNTFTTVGNQVGRGLYERYYQPMIQSLLDNPKKKVCYIDLKVTDILELDFRKMVYIDGVYYRILKVVDYQPHLNKPTKVELQAYNPAEGSAIPNEGTWINDSGNSSGNSGGSSHWKFDDPETPSDAGGWEWFTSVSNNNSGTI